MGLWLVLEEFDFKLPCLC